MLKEQDRWVIQVLHRDGNSIRQIRKVTGHSRNTIRNVLDALPLGASDEAPSGGQPARLKRSGRRSMLDPLKEFLLGRIKDGLSMADLLLESRERGFIGSRQTFQRFLRRSKAQIISKTER